MNRRRKRNKGLPHRVYQDHKTWFFVPKEPMRDPKDGKLKRWIRLAKVEEGESAMLRRLADLLGSAQTMEGSMPFLCAEFKAERVNKSSYEKETKDQYGAYLDIIASAFEEFHCSDVTTKDIADFIRHYYGDKPNTAGKVARLMKKMFRYAIGTRGWRKDNPIDQLETDGYETERRKVLLTHEQVQQVRQAGMSFTMKGTPVETQSGPMFGCLVDMAYLLWQRAIDIRELREAQIGEKVISFRPSKTSKTSGKAVDIVITPAIQEVIDRARRIKRERNIVSVYLFANRNGTCYDKSGLKSMWNRAKKRAGFEDVDMTFRDLRALAATDAAKAGQSKDELRKRLAHTTTETTEIYIKEVVPETSDIDLPLPWTSA